jgi:hypothetical protein
MRNVILSLPRCGSAWLAAYFGYLHDPLMNMTWDSVKNYSIVDTGAATDPEQAFLQYGADRTVVLTRNVDRVVASLRRLDFPVGRELVEAWDARLRECARKYGLPLFDYGDLFGRHGYMEEAARLADRLGEDWDSVRWTNQREVNVQHNITEYSRPGYDQYLRWLRAS